MEIIEQSEAFVGEGDSMTFSHSKVILKEGYRYFYARTKSRGVDTDPSTLDPHLIPASQIWPSFREGLTRAVEPVPAACYVKLPSLLDYGDMEASKNISSLILHEAEICETLRQHPHPYLAQYLGCVVDSEGRITGLCFVKYRKTLFDNMHRNQVPVRGQLLNDANTSHILHEQSFWLLSYKKVKLKRDDRKWYKAPPQPWPRPQRHQSIKYHVRRRK